MEGVLTLHGVSKDIKIEVKKVGEGTDPWKGYRAGFIGTFMLKRSDFGISYNLRSRFGDHGVRPRYRGYKEEMRGIRLCAR